MYSTCLFCNDKLGRNEVIEHFPVGRRLAFDEARGRLWVVCKSCERWNLTPLEERWEAIEECEKQFRGTKRRMSTDQIGIAKLREGLELVRIGNPLRPEMAAWRYGDQFGHRRKRYLIAGGLATVAIVATSASLLTFAGIAAISPLINAYQLGNNLRSARRRISIPLADGSAAVTQLNVLHEVSLLIEGSDLMLRLAVLKNPKMGKWFGTPRTLVATPYTTTIELRGEHAIMAAGAVLPTLNARGASAREVRNAVEFIEQAKDPRDLFRIAAQKLEQRRTINPFEPINSRPLKKFPNEGRIALEMVANEETERRALEGELHILEEMWKSAEEVAAISDDMFLSDELSEKFEKLKSGS